MENSEKEKEIRIDERYRRDLVEEDIFEQEKIKYANRKSVAYTFDGVGVQCGALRILGYKRLGEIELS